MNEIARRLREARLARGLSLGDLAAATRINEKFLEQIEAGDDFELPKIYRKTFIRSCAKELGLDLEDLLLAETADEAPVEEHAPRADISLDPPVERSVVSPLLKNPFTEKSQLRTMVIVVIFLMTALVLSIQWLGSDDPPGGGTDAVSPAATPGRTALTAFSRGEPGSGAAADGFTDSLILRATTTESVWVHLVFDSDREAEYTLPPNYSLTWKARENFLLTVGNPAGLVITLNGRKLDVLGGGNRPKKDIFISRKSLTD